MSEFYDDMQATAIELLAEFGVPRVLTRVTTGAYVPGQGTTTTESTFTANCIKLNYRQTDIDGTLIKQGDQKVFISPDAANTPETGDKITFPDGDWTVVQSAPIAPGDTTVIHDAQVRK